MITDTRKSRSILLFLAATEFNEQEYLIISSSLQRAGIKQFILSDANTICVGNNKLKVKNDVNLFNANPNNFGGLILVGGNGARKYFENKPLHSLIRKFTNTGKPVGAICIAPVILAKTGILTGFATCYPESKNELENEGIKYLNTPVVVTGKIITGQDPASAVEFTQKFLNLLS